jgi:hypothetical protein
MRSTLEVDWPLMQNGFDFTAIAGAESTYDQVVAALDAQYGSSSANGDTGIEGARRDASISTRDAQYYASRDTSWASALNSSTSLGTSPWIVKERTSANAQAAYSTNRANAQAAHDAALLSAVDNWQTSNRASTLSLLLAEGQSREAYHKATASVYANWEMGFGNLLGDKPAGTGWDGSQQIANQELPPSIGAKATPTAKAGLQLVSAKDESSSQDEEVPEDGNIWSLPNRPSPKQLEPLYDHYGKEVADQMIESRWPSKPIPESKYSIRAYEPNEEERFAQSIPGYWRLQHLIELSESGALSAKERDEAQALASEYMFRYRLARGSDGSFLGYLNMTTGLTIAGQNPNFNQFMSGAAALVATSSKAVRPNVRLDVKPRYTQQPVIPAPWSAPKPVTPSIPQNKIPPVAPAPALGKILENAPNSIAGSAEHKALRWKEYQDRGGGWTYERWSNVYEQNMGRARAANKVVDDYHGGLGWGRREVTVDVDGVPRKLDIADVATRRGFEVKSGYTTLNAEIRSELARDAALRGQGWDIRWHFDGTASKPLMQELDRLGIPYTGGN